MPTGYTAQITDAMTLREFAMICARAFGALVMMRDDSMSAPIPKAFEPSDYHAKALAQATSDLAALELLSDEEAKAVSDREYDKMQADFVKAAAENEAQEGRYRRMLALVLDWTPPTPDHDGMKKFMREQIEESIKFDCDKSYYREQAEKPRMSGAKWKAERRKSLQHDIEYHEQHNREEIERTNERNKWIADLRGSL